MVFELITEGTIPGTHEQPDYCVVLVERGQITEHQRWYLYDGPTVLLFDLVTHGADRLYVVGDNSPNTA